MLEGVHGNAMALRLDGKVLARDVEHRLQTLIERRLAEEGTCMGGPQRLPPFSSRLSPPPRLPVRYHRLRAA